MSSPGLININTAVYFMEDSGMLYVKHAQSCESHVKFILDHSDCMQSHHQLTERSYVTLKDEQYPDWKKECVNTLTAKIMSQLEKVNNDEPWSSMRYYLHFGRHYFMNAINCLQGYASSISVQGVQRQLDASSSNRKDYGRNGFDPRSLPLSYTQRQDRDKEQEGEEGVKEMEGEEGGRVQEGEGSADEIQDPSENNIICNDTAVGEMMISEKQKGTREDNDDEEEDVDDYPDDTVYDEVSSDIDDDYETKNSSGKESGADGSSQPEKKNTKNKHMKTGFQNTVFDRIIPCPAGLQGGLKEILPGLEAFGMTVLGGMGYRCLGEIELIDGNSERETMCEIGSAVSGIEVPIVWQVTIVASASYQVEVSLSQSLEVLRVSERPLSWVSGTILAGVHREIDRQTEEDYLSPSPSSSACTPASPTGHDLTPTMSVLKAHDVRVKLASSRNITPEDELYLIACPGGLSPIEIDPLTLLPIPSPRLLEDYRVTFVKKLMDRTTYVYSDSEDTAGRGRIGGDIDSGEHPVKTTVNISRSLHFKGDGLTDVHCVGDMSLDVDISALIEYHRDGQDYSQEREGRIHRFLENVNKHALEISDRIEAMHAKGVC